MRSVFGWMGVVALVAAFCAGVSAQTDGPALTELEKAKVELLQVRTAYAQLLAQHDACKAELGAAFNALGSLRAKAATDQLSTEEMQLRIAVEGAHPGYTWDPKTQAFTKKPEPPSKK